MSSISMKFKSTFIIMIHSKCAWNKSDFSSNKNMLNIRSMTSIDVLCLPTTDQRLAQYIAPSNSWDGKITSNEDYFSASKNLHATSQPKFALAQDRLKLEQTAQFKVLAVFRGYTCTKHTRFQGAEPNYLLLNACVTHPTALIIKFFVIHLRSSAVPINIPW